MFDFNKYAGTMTRLTNAMDVNQHIKLLESFKQNQLSQLIEQIETKVFELLYSKHVSPRILGYFDGYERYFKSKDRPTEPPFTDYEGDPDSISQIKKLINALHYTRLTFLDLEDVDVRKINRSYADLRLLYSKTIDLAYEASYLATHLDVDVTHIFHEEIALLLPILSQVQNVAEQHNTNNKSLEKALLQPLPLIYKSGEAAGIAIEQMRPASGEVDYNFLTQFSAVLPGYIDRLTCSIKEYSSQIKENEPKLNKKKLDELQDSALSLLNEIENLKGNSVFVSLKFLNYIHIISNVITLSMSSLEQIGEFSQSSQDLIRDKLAQFKYILLPTLFGLVDKIEANSMLKPGTLSIPLMTKVKELYDALLYLPKKSIDFKARGAELLEVEDSRFIELRLEMTYQRIDNANKSLFKLRKAAKASHKFFDLLNRPEYKNSCLHQLPSAVREKLKSHYKLLKPFMSKLDIDLNRLVIDQLENPKKETWGAWGWRLLRYKDREDHIPLILAQKKALEELITKDETSQLFHIELNKDLIASVQTQSKVVLFPHSERVNVYAIDESIPLQIESESERKFKITKEEFKRIYDAYSLFVHKIKSRTEPNNKKLQPVFTQQEHKECRDLFKIFQPYFSAVTSSKLKESAKEFEKYFTNFFDNNPVDEQEIPLKSQFLNLDEHLEKLFTHIKFEWADNNEFDTMKGAYNEFTQLLKDQIEKKSDRFGYYLSLNYLDNPVKERCKELYKLIGPYFKLAISPKNEVIAQKFERYLTDFFANRPIELLHALSIPEFDILHEDIQKFLTSWKDKSTHYYDVTYARFLNEDESNALRIKRKKDSRFHFEQNGCDRLLRNREQLTADQALGLSHWYNNKRNKFESCRVAYQTFMELLSEQIGQKPQIANDILLLEDLDPKIKNQCRNLYHIFQAYCIDAVPVDKKDEFLKCDKYLVAILSGQEVNRAEAPTLKMFLELNETLQDSFENTAKKWKASDLSYMDLAHNRFGIENAQAPFENDAKTRAHFVLQTSDCSKRINNFRTTLFTITTLFNKAMQAELTPQTNGVPFPEMEDYGMRLSQSEQLCALKDVYNSMYHLEGIVNELEQLNNKSAKSVYVFTLLKAYGHVNEIIKLSGRLVQDPHWGFIFSELHTKARKLYHTFQNHSDVYQADANQVPYGENPVQFNSLWYVLKVFYISPKHIEALKNANNLTYEELEALQLQAKKATLFIERLINSSDSYLKLFLQTPNMIYLYQEMTKKLNEFTTTAHDAAVDNLDKMRASILTPMLIEADLWEDKLGLKPGNLSGPIRTICDEFYKGFLHPLGLPSKKHCALVNDREPLEQRTRTVEEQIRVTQQDLETLDKEYEAIEALYQCYQIYKDPISMWPTAKELEKNEQDLREAYEKALPILQELKDERKIEIAPSHYDEDHVIDDLCNSGLKPYQPHLTEIERLIQLSHQYYLGLKATYKMRLNIAEEKREYLRELELIQEAEHVDFIEKYTTESFDKQVEAFCNRPIGLVHTYAEYREKLKNYLLFFKSEIINQAKNEEDINLKIKNLLKEKTSLFEETHYEGFYHLNAVQAALNPLGDYCTTFSEAIKNKGSLLDPNSIWSKKSWEINTLVSIIHQSNLTVETRLDQIKAHVNNPRFSTIILAEEHTDTFSLAYLKSCLISLLSALNLYKPKEEKLLNQLRDTVQTKPEISKLTQRFGLFAPEPKIVEAVEPSIILNSAVA